MNNPLFQIIFANANFNLDKAIRLTLELALVLKLRQQNPNNPTIINQSKQYAKKILEDLDGEDKAVRVEKAITFLETQIKTTT